MRVIEMLKAPVTGRLAQRVGIWYSQAILGSLILPARADNVLFSVRLHSHLPPNTGLYSVESINIKLISRYAWEWVIVRVSRSDRLIARFDLPETRIKNLDSKMITRLKYYVFREEFVFGENETYLRLPRSKQEPKLWRKEYVQKNILWSKAKWFIWMKNRALILTMNLMRVNGVRSLHTVGGLFSMI